MARYGVRTSELFGRSPVAHRRVESVEPSRVEVLLGGTSAWLPRSMVRGRVEAGQWLRFSREGEAIRIEVDLRTTARAEARLADLFIRVS